MKWSEADTLEFVKIYLKKECLWNPLHLGYRQRSQREKCYFEIVTEFKAKTSKVLTITEARVKIKNLRTTYSQQVHKILEKSNPDDLYEPSLIWFNEMDRCLKNVHNRHTSAFNQPHFKPEVDSSQAYVDPEMDKSIEEPNPDPLIPETNLEYENEPSPIVAKKEKHHTHKKNKKRRKHKVLIQDCSTDSTSENSFKEDEFDIYGKFIASQLRQMDLSKALRLQLAIQNLVSEARMSDLCNDE